ncbi:MAG: lysophospholipid acyltransferase family protein [Acidobacteriota bacterium]|nr:lysophospholipid acyltransferase family protein [Acidobacteriota bacterium]
MLTAEKNVGFEFLFSFYNRNLIKRRFHSLQVSGLNEIVGRSSGVPLILYANHSSWWDGLVAFEISRKCKLSSFIMMEERQLKKLFLFRQLGAFSVVRENPRQAVKSIDYAAQILKKDFRHSLWIFPQGEILSNDLRPVRFFNGISRIVEKTSSVQLLPVAIRYEFLENFKPDIFVKIGKLEMFEIGANFQPKKYTEILAIRLTRILDKLKNEITCGKFDEFEKIT